MTPSQKCFELIKSFESCRLVAFQDERSVWTIGWGRTLNIKDGDSCTQEEADEWLADDVLSKASVVDKALTNISTTQNQFDAMVSFAYNIGAGGFLGSSVLIYHRTGEFTRAGASFLLWDKIEVNDQLVQSAGLQRRREAERNLYLTS